jgi:hypothetical protein
MAFLYLLFQFGIWVFFGYIAFVFFLYIFGLIFGTETGRDVASIIFWILFCIVVFMVGIAI